MKHIIEQRNLVRASDRIGNLDLEQVGIEPCPIRARRNLGSQDISD